MFFASFSVLWRSSLSIFFFFNDTATTEIYTLSLHDALPILTSSMLPLREISFTASSPAGISMASDEAVKLRSEEHTSELQSQSNLVCRLLLEKKKKKTNRYHNSPHTRSQTHTVLHTLSPIHP